MSAAAITFLWFVLCAESNLVFHFCGPIALSIGETRIICPQINISLPGVLKNVVAL